MSFLINSQILKIQKRLIILNFVLYFEGYDHQHDYNIFVYVIWMTFYFAERCIKKTCVIVLDRGIKQNISSFIVQKRKTPTGSWQKCGRRKGLATRALSFPASIGLKRNRRRRKKRDEKCRRPGLGPSLDLSLDGCIVTYRSKTAIPTTRPRLKREKGSQWNAMNESRAWMEPSVAV